jgi:hypothetical protein
MKLSNPLRAILILTFIVALCSIFGSCFNDSNNHCIVTSVDVDGTDLFIETTGRRVNTDSLLTDLNFDPEDYVLQSIWLTNPPGSMPQEVDYHFKQINYLSTAQDLSELIVDIYMLAQANALMGDVYILIDEDNETYQMNESLITEEVGFYSGFDGIGPCIFDHVRTDYLLAQRRMVDNIFNCPPEWSDDGY